jgi:diguanylate cyclase (GGDEF)-like protein
MAAGPPTQGAPVRSTKSTATSLRSRWNRALAVLFAVVVVAAIATFVGTRVLVGSYRHTAEDVERGTTLLAQLRSDVAANSAFLHALMDGGLDDPGRVAAAGTDASVRAGFAQAMRNSRTTGGRQLLQQGFDQWQATVAATGLLDPAIPVPERLQQHRVVAGRTDELAALLDRAGAADRAAVRADLARASQVENAALAALVALGLLVIALLARFGRRLSAEVIRPLGILRDSANRLAAGELDHRVEFTRADELGDLAASFNAMADAIAGSQRNLTRQANHDSLTGLANRAAFRARLEAALARPERRGGTQAVLFVDLDDFKDVNDTLGHAAGDEVLTAVAARLQDAVRPGDLVARLGGDEFALLLDGVPDPDVALGVAERAVVALAAPVEVAGTWVHVGASVGLAMRHADSDPESIMREADVAMYSAKGRGKNRVERYDATINNAVADHHALKADLAGVAERGELVIDYQPIVDLTDGTFVGVEALVRWQHPTRGLLPPSAFIELAEETGAIVGIGSWVLETAAGQLLSWQHRYGLPELWLSVNVSVCQLDDRGFADHVGEVLRRSGLAPTSLVLEITESVLADPAGAAAGCLETLRRLGVQVALDDFGTGYSSIGYLRQLPIDILKIDRSFVSGEQANRPGDLLLEAIVGLAQRLGLGVIPEGIEEPDQLSRLRDLGCHTGQGFLLSRPVPAGTIDRLLANPTPLLPADLPEALSSWSA